MDNASALPSPRFEMLSKEGVLTISRRLLGSPDPRLFGALPADQRSRARNQDGIRRSRGNGSSEVAATLPQLASRLLAEMLVEKLGNLAERDGGLGQAIIEQVLRVRLTFVDLELRLHPSRAERAMHPHRV